jgi:hypothetical protein
MSHMSRIAKYDQRNLPEYILGENVQTCGNQLFVVRCHAPRFIGMVDKQPDGTMTVTRFEQIDPLDLNEVPRRMREMGDWISDELEAQCHE